MSGARSPIMAAKVRGMAVAPAADFIKQVRATVRLHRLIRRGDGILVALSGGPDSMALLTVLRSLAPSLRLTLRAIHVNYGLRGLESEADARFVEDWCRRLDVPLTMEGIALESKGRRAAGPSLQARARVARYNAFERTAAAFALDKVAVGHTADDQAETLLMWMLRGAGTAGLAGIPPLRDGMFIRPLLEVSRADVLSYLESEGIPFREDSSNAKPMYQRNRIRQELMPALKRLNPAILKVLTRQASVLREDDRCLDEQAGVALERCACGGPAGTVRLRRSRLIELPLALQRRVIRKAIQAVSGIRQGPRYAVVESILDRIVQGRSGSVLSVAGAVVGRDYDTIDVRTTICQGVDVRSEGAGGRDGAQEVELPQSGTVLWPATGAQVRVRVASRETADAWKNRGWDQNRVKLDADRISGPMRLRCWRPGDFFYPYGMNGRRKKLQDFFSDLKVPGAIRRQVPLLVAQGEILWVAGYRADHRFRVTSSTVRCVLIEYLPVSHQGGAC